MREAIRKGAMWGVLLFFWSWAMSNDDIRDGLGDVAKTGREAIADGAIDVWDEFDLGELEWK